MSSDNSNSVHNDSKDTTPPVRERVAFHTISRHKEQLAETSFADYSAIHKQKQMKDENESFISRAFIEVRSALPGLQSPTTIQAMDEVFLCSDAKFKHVIDNNIFDFIVIGSGFTSLGFVDQTLSINPSAQILVLERGDYWLPDHFQNLSLPFKATLSPISETFPFSVSERTLNDPSLKFVHGSCPYFGGRSNFWSAWCPEPSDELMREFSKKLIDTRNQENFFERAKSLIKVIPMDEVDDMVYAQLQDILFQTLSNALAGNHKCQPIPGAEQVLHAPLAVRNSYSLTDKFKKFSTVAPFVKLYQEHTENLVLASRSIVSELIADSSNKVKEIKTSRGNIQVNENTKIILSAGVFPNTVLLRNSFPMETPFQKNLGKRLSGHFLTHIVARCPKSNFDLKSNESNYLQIAALYLAGRHPNKLQYHIQITGINAPRGEKDAVDAGRECPDYAAAATAEQLKNSEEYVVFVCASLGEFDEKNIDNWIKDNPEDSDKTTNITVQYVINKDERDLWDMMDEATFVTIENMCLCVDDIQYWDDKNSTWMKQRPKSGDVRVPGIVHEACPLWMGESSENSVVAPDYRPWGVENVYVTGAAIFPSSGSWNPTLTMVGYAQDFADQLNQKSS